MPWPLSQDYNEAIQNPRSSFSDPELRDGQAIVGALQMPLPRSGNFADVYEFQCARGCKWAIKCFTREVKGLQARYNELSVFLQKEKLPFIVDFQYQPQGIRVRGASYPILKMNWVEGLLLNEFVRQNLDKPKYIEGLSDIWVRLSARLRGAGMAHADLQHGNVMLVHASRMATMAVKLIDYDGMFVPALAKTPSGEVGHPAYQHPERLLGSVYSAEVDRLPLLAVGCALRALAVAGKPLWDKYDNGDNFLFREPDLRNPAQSPLFGELWNMNDAPLHDLVGYLVAGLANPLDQTPLLHEIVRENRIQPMPRAVEKTALRTLGLGARIVRTKPAAVKTPPDARAPQTEPRIGRSKLRRAVLALCGLAIIMGGGYFLVQHPELYSGSVKDKSTKDKSNHEQGWTQLFNGEDLSGWKTFSDDEATWVVKDDVLIGAGPVGHNHLFTERGDYKNFHLRADVKVNKGGAGAVFFRATPTKGVPDGYAVLWRAGLPVDLAATSERLEYGERLVPALGQAIASDRWFTLEILAERNLLTIKVNSETVIEYTEQTDRHARGHLALMAQRPLHQGSVVQYRRIEVRELPAPDAHGK